MTDQQLLELPLARLQPHEKNPRLDATPSAELISSIRENGIQIPLVAAPALGTDDYVLLAGHCRRLAAIELGLETVPVLIRADLSDVTAQLRFIWDENSHRSAFSVLEQSRFVQDCLDLGMSQTDLARATAMPKDQVQKLARLAKLPASAGGKVHRGQISIDDALLIADYADDPDAVEELTMYAGTRHFNDAAASAKARRTTRIAEDRARKAIKKAGARVADPASDFIGILELSEERRFVTPALEEAAGTVEGEEWTALLVAEHSACEGHCGLPSASGPRWGCDKAATEHPQLPSTTDADDVADAPAEDDDLPEPVAAAESAPKQVSPWAAVAEVDLLAARYGHEAEIAEALVRATNLKTVVTEQRIERLMKVLQGTASSAEATRLGLLGFLGLDDESGALRALRALPLPSLVLLDDHLMAASISAHRGDPAFKDRDCWDEGPLDRLMRILDVDPGLLERRLYELHGGQAWDAAADGGELA